MNMKKLAFLLGIGLLFISFDVCGQNRQPSFGRPRVVVERQPSGLKTPPQAKPNKEPAPAASTPAKMPPRAGASKKSQVAPPEVPSRNRSKAIQPATSAGERKNQGGIKVVPTVNPKDVRRIIQTLEGYDPMHIPQPGEKKQRIIGSDNPVSSFKYKGKDVTTRVAYDTQDKKLLLCAIDEKGRHITEVVEEYDLWTWHLTGQKNVEEMEDIVRQRNLRVGVSGSYDESIFYTPDETQIPRDFLESKGIKTTKTLKQVKKEILYAHLAFSLQGTPRYGEYSYFSMPNLRVTSDKVYSHPTIRQLLSDVSQNIKKNVQNPWFHYTDQEVISKKLPEIISERLYPGQWSEAGFLGKNDDFYQVVRTDTAFLKRIGISNMQLADAVSKVITETERARERGLSTDGFRMEMNGNKLLVEAAYTKGFQLNPFQELINWHIWKTGAKEYDWGWGSKEYKKYGDIWLGQKYHPRGTADFTITNLATKQSVSFGDMAPVLMAMGFYEGPGTPYRMDPKAFVNVLGLKKLED